MSVTNARIRLSRNLPRESSLSNHSILPLLLLYDRHNYLYIGAKLRPYFVRREERKDEEGGRGGEEIHRIAKTLGQVDVSQHTHEIRRFATKHGRFFVALYSLRLSFEKT